MQNAVVNNRYKRWTKDEYNQLINAIKNDKMSHENAARLIGRSIGAITFRLKMYIYDEITYSQKNIDILSQEVGIDKDTVKLYYNEQKEREDVKVAKNRLKLMKANLKRQKERQGARVYRTNYDLTRKTKVLKEENDYNIQMIKRMDLLTKRLESFKKLKNIRSDNWNKEMSLACDEFTKKIEKNIDKEILNQLIC